MIERDSNTIRAIAWSEVFPWLSILRVFRLAIAARALVLGAAAILITATGWAVIGSLFGTADPATQWLQPYAHCPWEAVTEQVGDVPPLLSRTQLVLRRGAVGRITSILDARPGFRPLEPFDVAGVGGA